MQNLVIVEPYQFVPPIHNTFWTWPVRWYLPHRIRSAYGVEMPLYRGSEKIREAIAAGHAVMLAPNHCRPSDPEIVGLLGGQLGIPIYMMASWHLFKQSRFQRFALRAVGIFSVHREGVDREALRAATAMLVEGKRPLILFPEGLISRSNDRLRNFMDGTAFIARAAAKARAKANLPGKVLLFPVALRYTFGGDLRKAVEPVLTEIEKRLTWQPQTSLPLVERVIKLGEALLGIKEMEYFGESQSGRIAERLPKLMNRILSPHETVYSLAMPLDDPMERIKILRTKVVEELVAGKLSQAEKDHRWRVLADCYFAQTLACYPVDYLAGNPSVERILETVERYEEDITDTTRIHRPLRVVVEVGDAIEVGPDRPRGGDGDPVTKELEFTLQSMITASAATATPWREETACAT